MLQEARSELNEIALLKCDDYVRAFAECAQEKGMMVVFMCRDKSNAMNKCLSKYSNQEQFEKYKLLREKELCAKVQND